MTKQIVIDIETIPTQDEALIAELAAEAQAEVAAEVAAVAPPGNYKSAETIDKWWAETGLPKKCAIALKAETIVEERYRRTGLDGAYGQLAVIGVKLADDEPLLLYDWGTQYKEPGYEHWLLRRLNKLLREVCASHLGQQVIGHNLSFDRTFLRQRGMVLGVTMHPLITAIVKPWENNKFIDTMQLWTGDVREKVKLDKLCRALGVPRKGSELPGEVIDGSKVWDFVKAGQIEKVARYCAGDCDRTWHVYNRLRNLLPVLRPAYTPSWEREDQPSLEGVQA